MRTSVYIDDSGNPGCVSKSKYDTKDRKTWIALILNSEQRNEVHIQMLGLINELKSVFNLSEFHFTDIYSGTKEYKGLDLQFRLGIFRMFADIHRKTQFPMLIQTFTSDDILRNRIIMKGKKIMIDNFDLKKVSDFALYYLLIRLKGFFDENTHYSKPIEIIIDEGRQKKNTTQDSFLLKGMLYEDKIYYKSSSDEPLLQLIDFVAFTLNRVRWILTNNKKRPLDLEFLKIASRANFNMLNIKSTMINVNSDFTNEYDSKLRQTYDKNGNLSDLELAKLKNGLIKKRKT